jgi:hypothetical protein
MVISNVALKEGSSKHGNAVRAIVGSNSVVKTDLKFLYSNKMK